jgi:hypothetical protein
LSAHHPSLHPSIHPANALCLCFLLLLLPAEYDKFNSRIWATNTDGWSVGDPGNVFSLVCHNDGYVVLYDDDENIADHNFPIWSSDGRASGR